MSDKSLGALTAEQVKDLAKDCTRGAKSTDEVRRRLSEVGFNDGSAAVAMTSYSKGGQTMHMFMVMVSDRNGNTISC